jgi:beta-N-acetylhexosaminidase
MLNVPSFPWPMAFGAVNSETDVECFGAMTAREARAVGIHWALAPVADLNTNPSNPIINDRSFGEDPGDVGILVAAYIRGARRHGLLVTAKHFPGQGDTSVDSHRGVPSVDGTLNHLEAFEFRPFKSAIDAGVDSVMVAHARVSAVEPDPNKVATVSRKVVTDLLRDKLGFNGVILTDALEMKGLTSLYNPRDGSPTALAAVDAVKAGCDVIMVPADLQSAFRAILNAVRNGEIPSTRIDDSVRRILKMKADIGLNSSRCVPLGQVVELTSKSEDVAFAQQIADQAITLVRENGRTLPLKTIRTYSPLTKNNLRTILLAEAFETSNGQEFEKAIRVRRPDSSVYYVDNRIANTDVIELLKSVTDADEVVVAVYLVHHGVRQIAVNGLTTTVFGPVGPSGRLLREILAVAADKTVVVALGSPYLIESFPQIQNYVCAYAMASSSEISAVKALFGEIQNAATLPVTLPGAGARGSSRPWPTQPRAIVS